MSMIDDSARVEIRRGLRVAALFFIGLLGGASMMPLDAGVYARGAVIVSGKRQAVQNRGRGHRHGIARVEGRRSPAGRCCSRSRRRICTRSNAG
ncbi:hypothetical protein [Sphingomonas sp. Ant20]|uniref:hypothetical protein n=1 Tax=Sphingomonas sp. Ant20 TaxID=104605 RepID=UPI00068B4F11|nr:hypothetical protein [Sphingomonas sp. Ant20]